MSPRSIADSDEVARGFRNDVARRSKMMPPGSGASLASDFLHPVRGRSILGGPDGARASQAVAGEIDPVSIADEAIEDGIGVSGIADQLVPFVDRNLAGDDCRSAAVTFFEDLEEVVTSDGIERLEAPVVGLIG